MSLLLYSSHVSECQGYMIMLNNLAVATLSVIPRSARLCVLSNQLYSLGIWKVGQDCPLSIICKIEPRAGDSPSTSC
jgi:hypothetical protein